jgi:hypothetical protein
VIVLSLLLVLPAADPDDGPAKKMLPIYVKEATEYSMAVESSPKKALGLKKEPIFEWSNPTRNGGQQGAVFLWLHDGRPAALACMFSHPEDKLGGRTILHELHALDPEKLVVSRPGAINEWRPKAGLDRRELTGAPAPADAPAARLLQMKKLAAGFSGYSVDREKKRWDLRLLPAPLYRYPAAKTGAVDGALFALVTNAGTDPEVLLLIEAREEKGKVKWEYACGRFSDWELRVTRNDKEVYSSVPGEENPFAHDPQHLYRIYADKVVSPEGKVLARIRQTAKNPFGDIIREEDK